MPAADVSQHALAVCAVRARSLAVRVGVIVMTRRCVAEPREPAQPLALCKHVRGDARLPAREGLYQQVALELGDVRPILHIAVEIGRIYLTVFWRQSGDRALQVADARQMFFHSGLVVWRQSLL